MTWYKKAQAEMSNEEFEDSFGGSKWIDVDSSWIDKVAYFEPLGMFEILVGGKEYSFRDVPKKTFENFIKSKSKGRFFNDIIRKNYSQA